MSRFTEQKEKDVQRIMDVYEGFTGFYTVKELLQKAWEFGHAYQQGYGLNYPEKDKETDGD